MPRFSVIVERTVVDRATIEVSADNEDEAADEAVKLVEKRPSHYDWELESDDFEAIEAIEEEDDEDSDDDIVEDEEDDEDEA